jgi:hypothetical protein
MDRSNQLRHLATAERNIARGERNIFDQELRVEELDVRRHDSTLARSVLETFRQTQAKHIAHRDQILKQLAE